jgi:LuxR family maltose regulon positive regulatory protein
MSRHKAVLSEVGTGDVTGVRTVRRSNLIRRIRATDSSRVVSVVAPAGYGKSTLLAQWADQESVPGAQITVRPQDEDPALLLRHITDTLGNAGLLTDDAAGRLEYTSATALTTGVTALAQELGVCPSGLLALDQLEALRTTAAKDTLAALIVAMPSTITVAMASRSELPILASVLRVKGELLELSAQDLALSVDEASELADIVGVRLDHAELEAVVRHTEGWPAGLYLTFLRVKSGVEPSAAAEIGGDDRFISQYLRSEVLGRLTPARKKFLLQTSVLEELSSQNCDFVLERTGSERVLTTLAASSRFVVSVDPTDRFYRYHQMLREFLLAELGRGDPNLIDRLNLKAAEWYEQANKPVDAVRYAIRANDPGQAARLVAQWSLTVFSEGNVDTVLEWVTWFDTGDKFDDYPEIALLGAMASAEIGDHVAVVRWIDYVDRANDLGALAPVAHLANAMLGRKGIQQCLVDARAAQEGLPASSEWYAPCVGFEGLALLWSGQTDAAHERLELTAQTAERFSTPTAAMFTLATLASLVGASGDVARAGELAARALHRARSTPQQYATSVLAFAVAARSALRRGDPGEAQALLAQAHTRRPMLSPAMPLVAVQTLLEMCETHIELADYAGARQVLRDASAIADVRSVGLLNDRCLEIASVLEGMPAGSIGAATLTNAELRLLPLLATHLSFPQIGERLYISRHTVKTQAMAIYRKLESTSRNEAVERARELHLLNK